jgi:hypothetical protein
MLLINKIERKMPLNWGARDQPVVYTPEGRAL